MSLILASDGDACVASGLRRRRPQYWLHLFWFHMNHRQRRGKPKQMKRRHQNLEHASSIIMNFRDLPLSENWRWSSLVQYIDGPAPPQGFGKALATLLFSSIQPPPACVFHACRRLHNVPSKDYWQNYNLTQDVSTYFRNHHSCNLSSAKFTVDAKCTEDENSEAPEEDFQVLNSQLIYIVCGSARRCTS